MRTATVFQLARDAQMRGDFNGAANALTRALDDNRLSGEITLELLRVLLRAGHVKRAREVAEAFDTDAAKPGLRLRIAMERIWIDFLQTFDLATAVHEVDAVLLAAADKNDIAAVDKADAKRVHCRILKAAAIYREIDSSRAGEATKTLGLAAETLQNAGWIDEALNARLLLCKWQQCPSDQQRCYMDLARAALDLARPDMAGEAWLCVAELRLKALSADRDVSDALALAERNFEAAGNELGEVDVARVATSMRLERFDAPASEMEDVLQAYQPFDVPARELIVVGNLSVRAHQTGDIYAALRYRNSEAEIGLTCGLMMPVMSGILAQADLLMRARRLSDAVDICSAVLDAPLPRIMRGNFEQFIGTAHSFAGDRDAARQHLQLARQAYDEVGAEDFASIVITKLVNDTVSSRSLAELRDAIELAKNWTARDLTRADYEGASTKQQLIAQINLQLFRLPHELQGAPYYLQQAEAALQQASEAAAELTGILKHGEQGNIAQFAGQIAITRSDKTTAYDTYQASIIHFDNAGLAMQGANSRYILGCMALNTSADATRAGKFDTATQQFGAAETQFQQALVYYEKSDMQQEAARAHYMLARLYTNGRPLADSQTATQMSEAALEHLEQSGRSLGQIRRDREDLDGAPGKLWTADLARQAEETRDLAASMAEQELSDIWRWHQETRAVGLRKVLGVKADPSQKLLQILRQRPDQCRLFNREQSLLRRLDKATPIERPAVKCQLIQVREEMLSYDEFSDYLELAEGRSPPLVKVQAMLAAEPVPPVAMIDWALVNNRYMLLATSDSGLKARPVNMAPEDVWRIIADWRDWEKMRRSLQVGRDILKPLDPLIAGINELSAPGEHLVLCPTGPLAAIPLHALEIMGQPLIARNPVSYAPSIAVMRALLARRQRPTVPRDFVLADPESGPRASPESRALGRRLAALLGVTAIEGAAATRAAATTALQTGDIFHFQGHALFDCKDPGQSRLLLSDGPLTAAAIMGLADGINARLVTLGACQSAAMMFAAGDDPIGLPAALLMAGAHSIIAPIWPVDARGAAAFMEVFYSYLLGDAPVPLARALQKTVLDLAGSEHEAPPYSWAAYMLYGDWQRT